MKVMKFGGGCLRNPDTVLLGANIIKAQEEKIAVVVSAIYGITDTLIEAILLAQKNETDIPHLVASIGKKHFYIVDQLIDNKKIYDLVIQEIKNKLRELEKLLVGISYTGEVTQSLKSMVVSYGERLSAHVMAGVLNNNGKKAVGLSAADIGLVTDNLFDNATANLAQVKKNFRGSLLPLIRKGIIPVITGYFGLTEDGKISTFGRNGSDYSAAVIAYGIKADRLDLWKDVDGFMSADPRIVESAQKINHLSYKEAAELSYFGAKLLHPRTIEPLVESGIGLSIRNIHKYKNPGTGIFPQGYEKKGIIKSVTCNQQIAVLKIQGSGVGYKPGIIAKVGSVLADKGINIFSIITSQTCINLLIDKNDAFLGLRTLKMLKEGVMEKIDLQENIALIAVVGEGLLKKEGVAATVFSAVSRIKINIEMISAGASDVASYFLVKQTDLYAAVRAIHDRFFHNRRTVKAVNN